MAEDAAEKVLTEPSKPKKNAKAEKASRDKQLCHDQDIIDACTDLYDDIEEGFTNQIERTNDALDNWDIFNGLLGPKQMYNGTSQVFIPIVRDAIQARKTRFTNQIFPRSGRYVEVISEDATTPSGLTSLLDSYVRQSKLRTVVLPAMVKAGDVEGQYNIYTGWQETERTVAFRTDKPVIVKDDELDTEFEDPDHTVEVVEEETIKTGRPFAEVISDNDVLILPQTADSADEALAMGGSATIVRRWSKAFVKQKIKDDEIDKENGNDFVDSMAEYETNENQRKELKDKMLRAAGVQEQGGLHGLLYETWTMLTLPDGERRLCQIYFAGGDEKNLLSVKRCRYWNDKVPLLSVPVDKLHGVFKGQSLVSPVAQLQYQANDAVNMGMDSAQYSLLPIVMTDPNKNPKVGEMILSMAAIWQTSPQDTQFSEFPQLWPQSLQIVEACRSQIMTSLGVNPSMISQQASSKKPSQADIANEQAVDLLTTADAVVTIEEGILTPLVQRWVEYDHQFRDQAVTVQEYGDFGVRLSMEQIEPIQFDKHYSFRWSGVEAARNAQQIQQQIAAINVVRGIPPQMYPGYKLNLAPAIVQMLESTLGPRLAPLTFEDMRSQMEQEPQLENQILMGGMYVPVHAQDDDQAHIAAHMQMLQMGQDPNGVIRQHILEHQASMQQKAQAQPMPGATGEPGEPGGTGPGMSGTPRPGGQPAPQRPAQGPPGMIPQDSLQDPSRMPRPQRG